MSRGQLKFVTIILCVGASLFLVQGCKKCKTIDNGKAYLPDTSLNWLSYANTQVVFKNGVGDSAVFSYSETEQTFVDYSYPTDPFCQGCSCDEYLSECEHLQTNLTSALPFKFTIELYTNQPNFPGSFNVTFSEGAYVFFYVIADTSNSLGSNFVHFNQVTLNGNIYSDVFSDSHPSGSNQLYFNKQLGVVGFITESGETWSLQ